MDIHFLKHIDFESVLNLSDLVEYQPGRIVSRTLVQNKSISITLFTFDTDDSMRFDLLEDGTHKG